MQRVGRIHAAQQTVAIVNGFQSHHIESGAGKVADYCSICWGGIFRRVLETLIPRSGREFHPAR